ncbi:MAG: response regulator, partial [Desulfobacterales bacterium]
MKILIVDDIIDSRVLLRANLEFNEFSVMEASNGQQALEMVRKSPPDLIISDILMPVMDGFQLCRNIKQDDQLKNIPFVFYTATYTDQRDEELALKLGADIFIRKPAEPEEFVKILREVIETAEKGEIELKVRQVKDDREIFKLYDERLVKKLEQKMLDLKREITERKQTEKALREREKKYKTLLETTSERCWLIDPGLKTVEVNQALCKMLGYSQDEMLGKPPFDFVDDENRKIFIEQTSKISSTEHRSYKITLKKKNGLDLHTYFNATTIRDDSGQVQGSFAFITDITEYKRTQKERNLLPVAICPFGDYPDKQLSNLPSAVA